VHDFARIQPGWVRIQRKLAQSYARPLSTFDDVRNVGRMYSPAVLAVTPPCPGWAVEVVPE